MPGSFLSLFLPDQSQSSRQKILRIFLNEIQDFLNEKGFLPEMYKW